MTDTATHTLGVKQHGQGHPDHLQEDVALLKSHKLKPHPTIPRATKPILICVLDGWGESEYHDKFNAIHAAETPAMDGLRASAPGRWRLIKAHGTAVGLPSDADMGNSEVGHNALGAGQIVDQGAKCVDKSLETGEVWSGEGWRAIQDSARAGTLHLIGLLSDGGVHSRYDQLQLLMEGAVRQGVRRIRLHALSDGRDVGENTAVKWVTKAQGDIDRWNSEHGIDIRIASGGGRMHVTMDRYESDWAVVKAGYYAHVLGEAPNTYTSAIDAVTDLKRNNEVSDQWVDPWVVVDDGGKPVGAVQDGDAVVTFNFRADRMVEISKALEYEEFDHFDRKRWPKIKFAGIMQYDGELKLPSIYLVPPPLIERASEQYLVGSGVRIFACSESQKIGHVTFFWNGNRSGYLDKNLEEFVEIKSDQGISFDKKPEMKAAKIAERVKEAILSGKYDVIRCNFPNSDMVGHTGKLKATVISCAAADRGVKVLLDAVEEVGGSFLVTADHGNAEEMVKRNKDGSPKYTDGEPEVLTSHTLNPVPIAIGGPGLPKNIRFREDLPGAGLTNVTATYINMLGFEAPDFYEPSLITTDKP
ncbi:GPM1A [Auxenochlorella protothecoides x Auxenochlorella symbiontica]